MRNDPLYYIEGVLSGDRRVLSKTITLIESARADHQKMGKQIIDQLLPCTGNAFRLGITGVPGVGKSTFIETFGMHSSAHPLPVEHWVAWQERPGKAC